MKARQEYGPVTTDRQAVHIQSNTEGISDIAMSIWPMPIFSSIDSDIYTGTIELRTYVEDADSIRDWLWAYRKALFCVDCGRSGSDIHLQFHHVEPQSKRHNVSSMLSGLFTREEILGEIAKCVPVCWRCHRLRTAGQLRSGIIKPGKQSRRGTQHIQEDAGTLPSTRALNGAVLKSIRKNEHELTLAQASELSGLSVSYISKIENGEKGNALLSSLQKLANACGGHIELRFVREKEGVQTSYNLLK